MLERLKDAVRAVREWLAARGTRFAGAAGNAARTGAARTLAGAERARWGLLALAAAGAAAYTLYQHPPLENIGRGEVGVRINRLTGDISEWREGNVLVLPGLHDIRVFALRDQTYQPEQIRRAEGAAPLQSVEGLSFGVDLSVRYALDAAKLRRDLEDPARQHRRRASRAGGAGRDLQGVRALHGARDLLDQARRDPAGDRKASCAASWPPTASCCARVQMGKVDLPADYRRGMDGLLAEELATEKMRYTLELKDKRVKEIALDGEADKVRREKAAEAAAREQIIAAKGAGGGDEACAAVQAAPDRAAPARGRGREGSRASACAEGSAQARSIEAGGEADARQKLADAEAYRVERVGKGNAEQMAREGALVTQHPLLIQKTLADKLSDKIQVIIAPPPADGGFIGATLIGGHSRSVPAEK